MTDKDECDRCRGDTSDGIEDDFTPQRLTDELEGHGLSVQNLFPRFSFSYLICNENDAGRACPAAFKPCLIEASVQKAVPFP